MLKIRVTTQYNNDISLDFVTFHFNPPEDKQVMSPLNYQQKWQQKNDCCWVLIQDLYGSARWSNSFKRIGFIKVCETVDVFIDSMFVLMTTLFKKRNTMNAEVCYYHHMLIGYNPTACITQISVFSH